jgi:alpha-ketoglutarate-dependent taurine dioxygenase
MQAVIKGQVTIEPLSPLGACVHGLDLRDELSEDTKSMLRRAFDDHALLLFRDQDLTKEDLKRLAAVVGTISDQGEAPGGMNLVSNVNAPGLNEKGEHTLRGGDGELHMHFDHCFQEHPLRGILLYSVEVPPVGGDTIFADVRIATKRLPAEIRARIDGKLIRHKSYLRTGQPEWNHPIMYEHPRTHERVLFFSKLQAREILGIPEEECKALFEKFTSIIEDDEIIYRHHWQPRDVVLWDNIALQHARETFDPKYRRHLQRVQIG